MRRFSSLAALLVLGLAFPVQAAITFEYDYTFDGGFFSGGNFSRRAVFEAAGTALSSRLADTLNDITPGGGNTWSANFTNPGTGGAESVVDPTIAANTIRIYAGGRDLPGSTLGVGGPGGFSASGFVPFFDNLRNRGEPGITDGAANPLPVQTDFAPWGGSIAFDSLVSWHFDPITNPGGSENDFFSVALHEIGHLLGFGISNSWDSLVNGSNQFIGTASVAEQGGNVPLHTDSSHWAASTMSVLPLGGAQEAAMDPDITTGTKKFFTNLDFAGLDDIGWEVTPVPEPSTYLLVFGAFGALVIAHRRRRARLRDSLFM